MKVVINDELITLFLNKDYISSLDFCDKEKTHNYLKQLLLKMKNNYHLDFNGYYNMSVYVDKCYGIIVEVKKEEIEYLDYYSGIEINPKIINDSFLYEIPNIDNFKDKNNQVYIYKTNIYLKINKPLSSQKMGNILEHTIKIIYGNHQKKISKKAKEVIVCENQ